MLVWLLALWLSVEASGKGGGGKGKGIGGGFGGDVVVPPLAPPIPPPKIHVRPVPVPVKPCYPVTKQTTQVKLLDNYVSEQLQHLIVYNSHAPYTVSPSSCWATVHLEYKVYLPATLQEGNY